MVREPPRGSCRGVRAFRGAHAVVRENRTRAYMLMSVLLIRSERARLVAQFYQNTPALCGIYRRA